MRRWLLAIFALHFLVNLGLFAFGKIDLSVHADASQQLVAAMPDRDAHPSQDDDLLGAAPDHGLTDSQPDLPDGIQQVSVVVALGVRPEPPMQPTLHALTPPVLDGLRRPPRTLHQSV